MSFDDDKCTITRPCMMVSEDEIHISECLDSCYDADNEKYNKWETCPCGKLHGSYPKWVGWSTRPTEAEKMVWISVKDRLPDNGSLVLFSDGQVIFSGIYLEGKWYIRTNWVELNPIEYQEYVTMWVLLPDEVSALCGKGGKV